VPCGRACHRVEEAYTGDLYGELDQAGLAFRLERSGFGHLLRQDILDHYRSRSQRPDPTRTRALDCS
jgi:hypothetical protein